MSELLEVPILDEDMTTFNLRRWDELLVDPELQKVVGRVETDRFGRILMSPPPGYDHGGYQVEISVLFRQLLPSGRTTSESPISTSEGVRAADVCWASKEFLKRLPRNCACLPTAPEICVEIVSPSNTRAEMEEKRRLYFEAGAAEFWLCVDGAMSFYLKNGASAERSLLCPDFPTRVEI